MSSLDSCDLSVWNLLDTLSVALSISPQPDLSCSCCCCCCCCFSPESTRHVLLSGAVRAYLLGLPSDMIVSAPEYLNFISHNFIQSPPTWQSVEMFSILLRRALQMALSFSNGISPQTRSYRRMPRLQTVSLSP